MNHVVLSNSLAVESGVVRMRMTEQTMKTVPAAETQTLLCAAEENNNTYVFHQQR